jgi:hypothetical protein
MFRLSTRATVIAGMLAASTLGMVGMTTGVAGAAGPTVTCTGFSATGTTTSAAKLTGCTSSVSGGTGTAKSTENVSKGTGSDTITWGNEKTTKTTFIFTLNKKYPNANKCAKGQILVKEISTVVKGGTAKLPVGEKETDYLCAKTSGGVTLLKGQNLTV